MTNKEKKFLESFNNSLDNKMDFNDIKEDINYNKYKKEKKAFRFTKISVALTSLIITIALVLIYVTLPNDNHSNDDNIDDDVNTEIIIPTTQDPGKIPTQNPPGGTQQIFYDGFIKESFENNIKNKLENEIYGPMPENPVIDSLFIEYKDNIDPLDKPINNLFYELRKFEYIYEITYSNLNDDFVVVYIDKTLASKIYEENKEICDAPTASPLNYIDGSIVDWFYTYSYYDQSKVIWLNYEFEYQIQSEIDNFVCVGVYKEQQRTITKEILNNNDVNIIDYIFTPLIYKNDNLGYLTAINNTSKEYTTWYAANTIIDESNKELLFYWDFNNQFECMIDLEKDEITINTYSVQDENELANNTFTTLHNFYISTNSIIINNNNLNKEFGKKSYITYKYSTYIEMIRNLSN